MDQILPECQGYTLGPSLLYQDKKSTMLLGTSGLHSASKLMKHIKVQYFFIKDNLKQGEIKLQHCPIKEMWVDVSMKPKLVRQFCDFHSKLMKMLSDPIPQCNKMTID